MSHSGHLWHLVGHRYIFCFCFGCDSDSDGDNSDDSDSDDSLDLEELFGGEVRFRNLELVDEILQHKSVTIEIKCVMF